MLHWNVEINGKKAEVRGKELKNGMFMAFKKSFADLPTDQEFTVKVTPVVKEVVVKEPKAKKETPKV